MKSLQAKLVGMLSIMLAISILFSFFLVREAQNKSSEASLYQVMDKVAGHINSAAAWQAIERGVGATMLASSNPPAGLLSKFDDLGAKGDEEVRQAMAEVKELLEEVQDDDLATSVDNWKNAYETLKSTRPKARSGSIDRSEWIPVATKNIMSEFMVRTVTFAPKNPQESVLSYNISLRPNVATLAEYAGRERAILGGAIASGKPIPPKTLKTLGAYRALVENASARILDIKGLSSVPGELVSAISAYEDEFLGGYQSLREEVYRASADGKPYPVSGSEWIGRATKAINSALAISNTIGALSEKSVEQIKSDARQAIIFNVVLFVIAVGVFAFVLFFIRRAVVNPIHRIIEMLTEGSGQIASASGDISASSQSLAQGATEQASSLEETSSALEQMASQTRQNSDSANQASQLAASARQDAEHGDSSMSDMIDAMKAINKSSEEISKIIKVIEEIAFQTNLLALNAAVEAARAGEHGKGFAVVAEEVRNLAQRSATAAKDTAALIEDAVRKAAEGGQMADKAGAILQGIVGNARKVTDIVGEIATATGEQAQGVDQINTAVTQMDQVTQQNAANAEQAAAASEQLSAQADSLNEVVDSLFALINGQGASPANVAPHMLAHVNLQKRSKPSMPPSGGTVKHAGQ